MKKPILIILIVLLAVLLGLILWDVVQYGAFISGAPTGKVVVKILEYILGGVALIVWCIIQMRAERKRSRDLQLLATRLGFENFNPGPDRGFAASWGLLNRFGQGKDRYAFNILRGIYHQQQLFVFDYHYQTGSGKSTRDHYYTMLMLVGKEAFPEMTIEPETLLSQLAAAFDSEDIKFESAEFSRTFRVRSKDKRFAYDVCNPRASAKVLSGAGEVRLPRDRQLGEGSAPAPESQPEGSRCLAWSRQGVREAKLGRGR